MTENCQSPYAVANSHKWNNESDIQNVGVKNEHYLLF